MQGIGLGLLIWKGVSGGGSYVGTIITSPNGYANLILDHIDALMDTIMCQGNLTSS
jgi:hypothetical protein